MSTIAAPVIAIWITLATACSPSNPPTIAHPLETTTVSVTVCVIQDGKADRRCTPGALNPEVRQDTIAETICRPGWTKAIRPPVAYTNQLKALQMVRYGEKGLPSNYEEDHLEPLEIGGNPTSPENLWPEPWNGPTGAHEKDVEENGLHRKVCSGATTLAAAQAAILKDWTH